MPARDRQPSKKTFNLEDIHEPANLFTLYGGHLLLYELIFTFIPIRANSLQISKTMLVSIWSNRLLRLNSWISEVTARGEPCEAPNIEMSGGVRLFTTIHAMVHPRASHDEKPVSVLKGFGLTTIMF